MGILYGFSSAGNTAEETPSSPSGKQVINKLSVFPH